MRVDRAVTLLFASTLRRPGLLQSAGAVPILMYHSVSDDHEAGIHPYYRLATSPARFREQMGLLAAGGYVVTSLGEALQATTAGVTCERQVVVTFDDGFVDFLANAWPVLQEFAFTASMFLPTAFIGETKRMSFKGRECLTWSEVRDLSRQGVSFGSHTVSHPVLYTSPWERIRSELRESRERLAQVLGAPVTMFAYPFAFPQQDAAFVSKFCTELRDQGYEANLTTVIGRHFPGDDPLQIRRLPVNDADDRRLFAAKLVGAYDWVGALQSAWKRARLLRTEAPLGQ